MKGVHQVAKDEEKAMTEEEAVDAEIEAQETVDSEVEETNEETARIEALEDQLNQKEDQVLRLSAEIKNMQARAAKERTQSAKFRSQSLAKELLPVIDSLEKALEIDAADEASTQLKHGIELVHTNFLKAFDAEGIKVIDPAGETFDPNYHQSVSSVPADDDHPADTVVQVYQKGYVLNERVLRPAMVIIAQ